MTNKLFKNWWLVLIAGILFVGSRLVKFVFS